MDVILSEDSSRVVENAYVTVYTVNMSNWDDLGDTLEGFYDSDPHQNTA